MIELTEQDVRRLVEVARTSGLKISDAARHSIESRRTPEFYLGFMIGLLSMVMFCRKLISTLGARIDTGARDTAESFAAENLTIEMLRLVTMRAAEHTAAAAEYFVESRDEGGPVSSTTPG